MPSIKMIVGVMVFQRQTAWSDSNVDRRRDGKSGANMAPVDPF